MKFLKVPVIIVAGVSAAFLTLAPAPPINHGCFEDERYIEWVAPEGNQSICIPVDDLPLPTNR